MPSARGARYLTLAGLAAGSAVAAHGGWAELSDPRWAGAAAAGAAIAAAGLAWTGAAALAARWATSELEHGRVPRLGGPAHRPLGVLEAAAVLVASQACAHIALLLAGAPAHPGAGGALALHLALALAAALVASGVDRALSAALAGLSDAVGRLLELLAALPAVRSAAPGSHPAPAPAARLPLGRAPPLAA
jgi:hypothetical protein